MDNVCMACNQGPEKILKWQKEQMEKYGWYAHYVTENDSQSPTGFNFHTHGANVTFRKMDFQIVVNITARIAHSIFASLMEGLENGIDFEPGKKYGEVIQRYQVMFKKVKEGDREVLRVIFPDEEGNLEEGEIEEPYSLQWE